MIKSYLLSKRRLTTIFQLLRAGKFTELLSRTVSFLGRLFVRETTIEYSEWRKNWVLLNSNERDTVNEWIRNSRVETVFSIQIQTARFEPDALKETLQSLVEQLYPNWIALVENSKTNQEIIEIVESFSDSRIKLFSEKANNVGDWLGRIDSGVLLHEAALFSLVKEIDLTHEVKVIYSDNDHLAKNGAHVDPYMKPDWNPDLLNYLDYLSPFVLFIRDTWEENFDPTQDSHELNLTATENLSKNEVVHVSNVLSTIRINDEMSHLTPYARKISYSLPDEVPKVSILIPTKDQAKMLRRCLNSIFELTDYSNLEVVIIDHETTQTKALKVLSEFNEKSEVKLLSFSGEFNFSAMINLGSKSASGEVFVLLNNDTEIIEPDWLNELVAQILRPEIGVVGSLLLFNDRTIQHAGIHPSLDGLMGHGHKHRIGDNGGYFSRLKAVHEVAAVTGACLAVSSNTWGEIGGLDESNLKVAYNDVDLCLQVRQNGMRVVLNPFSRVIHHESISRGVDLNQLQKSRLERETLFMKEKWGDFLHVDPAYSSNHSFKGGGFMLAQEPRKKPPWKC